MTEVTKTDWNALIGKSKAVLPEAPMAAIAAALSAGAEKLEEGFNCSGIRVFKISDYYPEHSAVDGTFRMIHRNKQGTYDKNGITPIAVSTPSVFVMIGYARSPRPGEPDDLKIRIIAPTVQMCDPANTEACEPFYPALRFVRGVLETCSAVNLGVNEPKLLKGEPELFSTPKYINGAHVGTSWHWDSTRGVNIKPLIGMIAQILSREGILVPKEEATEAAAPPSKPRAKAASPVDEAEEEEAAVNAVYADN